MKYSQNEQYSLYQPIEELYSNTTEQTPPTIKPLDHLIAQLRDEEDYYNGEQHKTKLMITRLRKIFYDNWGWSSEVIRGATNIPGRYVVTMIIDPSGFAQKKRVGRNQRDETYEYVGLIPVVVYSKNDKQYPERAGQVPDIYKNDNQEVILPEGYICDIGHILSGMDAMNYPAPVTPLRGPLYWLYKITPYVKSNVDFATWLGDLASTAGNFLFKQLQNKHIDQCAEEDEIEKYSPASDMLGNIDAYVMASVYNINDQMGARFTDMLKDYYYEPGIGNFARRHRCLIFCNNIGLYTFKDKAFSNEKQWIKAQKRELRNATAFYVYGDLQNVRGLLLALGIWLRFYDKKLQLELLLNSFLQTLKNEIYLEINTK
ncbi:MAG TPA: hypothetical protein PK199_07140 [Bacteroidales bacterium]|nr:hypothetical protein [Bacteroidales bacterium]